MSSMILCVHVDGTVTLRHVGRQHVGIYQCQAHNSISSAVSAGARLNVTVAHSSHPRQSLNPYGQSGHHSVR